MRDHPRMCGDHYLKALHWSKLGGSPPHVRGPRIMTTNLGVYPGITPACAGTTSIRRFLFLIRSHHPRMCGDHVLNTPSTLCVAGSPPHVRGPLPILDR